MLRSKPLPVTRFPARRVGAVRGRVKLNWSTGRDEDQAGGPFEDDADS